jgi:chromosome segregation ATPase
MLDPALATCTRLLAQVKQFTPEWWRLKLTKARLLFDLRRYQRCLKVLQEAQVKPGKDPATAKELEQILSRAQKALEEQKRKRAQLSAQIKEILPALVNADPVVVKKASQQIKSLGKEVVPVLIQLIKSQPPQYRLPISNILGEITGHRVQLTASSSEKDIEEAIDAWREWYDNN